MSRLPIIRLIGRQVSKVTTAPTTPEEPAGQLIPYLGSTQIAKLYIGSTEAQKAYLGSTLILDNTP